MSEPAFDELLRRLAEAPRSRLRQRSLEAIRLRSTDLGRLDIVHGLDGMLSYEQLRPRAVEAEILGVSVAVCSIDDLMAMKRAAGRTRDLADLEDLEAATGS